MDWNSSCRLCWPQTQRILPASASRTLDLKVSTGTPILCFVCLFVLRKLVFVFSFNRPLSSVPAFCLLLLFSQGPGIAEFPSSLLHLALLFLGRDSSLSLKILRLSSIAPTCSFLPPHSPTLVRGVGTWPRLEHMPFEPYQFIKYVHESNYARLWP